VLAPRYVLGAKVGRGGMAIVFQATDRRHARRVAVKVLHPALSDGLASERFAREIESVSRLTHPHIVPLIDSGRAGHLRYYIMPFLEEGTLADRIAREQRLDVDEALRIAREIADALAHAHAAGLIHRDVKPSNVMMASGHALVSDFGLAHAIDFMSAERLTPTDVTVGTPWYMSPEQFHHVPDLDPRSDQYSLACVVFEMLAGQPPFSGGQDLIAFQHCSLEPPPLSSLRPEAPFAVTLALQRALSKLATDRFASVLEFAEALTAEAAPAPAPGPVATRTPHNLPRLATSFVGRENEIWSCARLLDECRLVTLTGLGGSGKTRLAIRLAERRLSAHLGGVWFVELASVHDPSRVLQAVAGAIGARERRDRPLREVVRERLGAGPMLLVLDNCEHVREESAEVARALIEDCSELTVLATSREPLRVPGERVFQVPPLGVPPADPDMEAPAIANYEAVRLFVARAASVVDDFRLSPANAAAVADVCRTLEGIPLAIELASARVRMLSVEEIRAMLADRFRLVASAGPAAVERHQTLRAAIDWSYELLDPEERRMLRALAVFRGGWSLAAATAVSAAADTFAALDLMTRLAEKSLLQLEGEKLGESRYRMLETVRLYARECLEAEGEADDRLDLHLTYFLAVAEAGKQAIWQGTDQALWLERLNSDHENLLAALTWTEGGEARAEKGLVLADALYRFWYTRGHYETARAALERALRGPGAQAPTTARARALFAAAGIAMYQGRHSEARDLYTRCLDTWRTLGDPRGVASALLGLGLVDAAEGRFHDARHANRESLELYRQAGDTHSMQFVLHNLGDVALWEGAWSEARGLFEQAMAIPSGDRPLTAVILGRLALVTAREGRPDQAGAPLGQALRLARELKAMNSGVAALDVAGELAARTGHGARAARLLGCADALRERAALLQDPGDRRQQASVVEELRATLGEAAFARAWALDRELTLDAACASALEWLGQMGREWADTQ
jgi:non-specific serine/threonine protein kinase